jgi:hypothetical protein
MWQHVATATQADTVLSAQQMKQPHEVGRSQHNALARAQLPLSRGVPRLAVATFDHQGPWVTAHGMWATMNNHKRSVPYPQAIPPVVLHVTSGCAPSGRSLQLTGSPASMKLFVYTRKQCGVHSGTSSTKKRTL